MQEHMLHNKYNPDDPVSVPKSLSMWKTSNKSDK